MDDGNTPTSRPYGVIIVTVLGLLFLWALLSVRVVGVGKQAVVTRFGNIVGEWQSGLHVHAPWPIEGAKSYDIRVQKEDAEASAASQDLQDVKSTLVVNYHLDAARVAELHRTVGPDYKKRLIEPSIQESFKAVTAKFPISELITKRGELKSESLKSLKNRLEGRGIIIDDLSITNLAFSPEYTHAIELKQVAQQQAEQAQFNLQKANLDAQANQVQTAALTDSILQQQAIAKWNGVLPTTITGSGSIFSIPVK